MKIGLLGGSFNPPHLGHLHISRLAIKKLQLKQVWWLPTLQNPFKQKQQYLPYLHRLNLCQQIIKNEQKIICKNQSYYFTFLLVKKLQKKYPQHQFYWLCGVDCLPKMHQWQNFSHLLKAINIAVFARNVANKNALLNAKKTKAYQLAQQQPKTTKMQLFFSKQNQLSATKIREKKLVILLNEPIENMAVGLNSTLFYALLAISQGQEVYFWQMQNEVDFLTKTPNIWQLNQEVAWQLLAKYAEENNKIRENAKQQKAYHLSTLGQFLADQALTTSIDGQQEIEKIFATATFLNRLEPMKSPFPPEGKQDFAECLAKLQQKFSALHCPIGLSDKEYIAGLSTPSQAINTQDLWQKPALLHVAVLQTVACFKKLYLQEKNAKIVIKPKDSAQSTGVFSIEFVEFNGQINAEEKQQQTKQYQLPVAILENPQQLTTALHLFLQQQCKNSQTIVDVYGKEILLQPFLLGIAIGDFRTILLKDRNQQFVVAGTVFRQKIASLQNNQPQTFTTCVTAGQAVVSEADKYLVHLQKFIDKTLQYLQENSQKYQNVHFMGLDFIAKNLDATDFYLGEMNMHCPGLISMLGNSFVDACNIAKQYD